MKIVLVGGSFDDNGGRPSSLVRKFAESLRLSHDVILFNGGYYSELSQIMDGISDDNHVDAVFWWANVPNDKPKIRDVKSVNQRVMLVTSKRNDNQKYEFSELINRALKVKANLCVEFRSSEDPSGDHKFLMSVFDPLGNQWYEGYHISACCTALTKRLEFLKSITRQGTCPIEGRQVEVPNDEEFFSIVRDYATVFHGLINPAKEVTRFLGNSSFRCQRGFPSFKKDGVVYVSKRNIDKSFIDRDGFVPTELVDDKVYYYGSHKPSVDTPIQLRLYQKLPKINYMIHSHVYVKGAPFTRHMVPCGGLEEVTEVLLTIFEKYGSLDQQYYVVNLVGHGSLVMSSDVCKLKGLPYVSRQIPEKL